MKLNTRSSFGFLSALFLLLMISNYAVAQQKKLDLQKVDKAVLAELKSQKLVGVAIGIIQDSKVVYTKGYGFANIKEKIATSEKTVFNWASNSKPVMAIAALQLVEKGKLDLDESILTYLPTLNQQWKPVTARHLLCHQSGIPHYRNGKIVSASKVETESSQTDPLKSVSRFANSPLIYQPGEQMTYSSYAYVLLSAVVQAAGKEPIDSQLKSRILGPLKLESFQLDLPYKNQENWTMAYRQFGLGNPFQLKDTAHFWKHGAGGYKSNVFDFANCSNALMNSKLISKSTSSKMWTRQKLNSGKFASFGLGVSISGGGKALKVSHSGSQDETKTLMVFYPNQKWGIVVMSNTAHAKPGAITTAIQKAIR